MRVGSRSIEAATYEGIAGTEPLLVPFTTVAGFDDPRGDGTVEITAIGPGGTEMPGQRWVVGFGLP